MNSCMYQPPGSLRGAFGILRGITGDMACPQWGWFPFFFFFLNFEYQNCWIKNERIFWMEYLVLCYSNEFNPLLTMVYWRLTVFWRYLKKIKQIRLLLSILQSNLINRFFIETHYKCSCFIFSLLGFMSFSTLTLPLPPVSFSNYYLSKVQLHSSLT